MARRSRRRPAFVASTVVGGLLLAASLGAGARAADDPVGVADTYARAFTADQYRVEQARLSGQALGLGLRLRIDAGRLVVSEVAPGTPAASAGLLAGEEFVSIDDRLVDAGDFTSVVAELRASRSVDAVVAGADGQRRVRLTPAALSRGSVSHRAFSDKVRFVHLNEVVRGSADEVIAAASAAGDAGVVLDLRGNGGGLITEAVDVAGAFLGEGEGVSYLRADGTSRSIDLPRDDVQLACPLVVLVDQRTASAAEVVAGILQDHGRAVVVGTSTFGKGSVQEPVQLSDGSVIRRTVGTYTLPSGRSLDRAGLTPDVVVDDVDSDAVAEHSAVSVLQGLAPVAVGRG